MVNLKESIKTFKHKYLAQGIELTNRFNNLVGDSIISIHYTRNWIGEEPIVIENGKCHHVPYNGLNIGLRSGKRVVIFDSNCFSEYGGTFGIDIRELESDEIFENQIDQTKDSNWNRLIGEKIRSIKILWLDDDGWRSPKEINGNIVMVPDEKSQGIYPHGIEMIFENGETIYVLAVEPDEYIKTEKRYHYLRGGEEFVIVFNKEVARNQKFIIQGVDLMIE